MVTGKEWRAEKEGQGHGAGAPGLPPPLVPWTSCLPGSVAPWSSLRPVLTPPQATLLFPASQGLPHTPTGPGAAGGPWTSLFGVLATEAEMGATQLVESSALPTWRGAVFVLMWLSVCKQASLLPALSREENLGSGAPSVPPGALGPRPWSCVAGAVSL